MVLEAEGSPGYWNDQATDLDAAQQAVWSVRPEDWQRLTDECVAQIRRWLPESPLLLLDLGCGCGRLTIPLAEAYPDAVVVGLDIAERMLGLGMADAVSRHVHNVVWEQGDGRSIPAGPFDGVFSVVVLQHLQRELVADLIANTARQLAPGGRVVFQVVSDRDFEDEGHIPELVARAWLRSAGLEVVAMEHGVVLSDWLWIVGQKL